MKKRTLAKLEADWLRAYTRAKSGPFCGAKWGEVHRIEREIKASDIPPPPANPPRPVC